jgi:hypothetical protein
MSKPERVVQTPGEPTPDDKAQRDAAIAAADSAAMSEKLTSQASASGQQRGDAH